MTKTKDQTKTTAEPQRRKQVEKQPDKAEWLHPLLQLQRAAGNQAVARLLKSQSHFRSGPGTNHSGGEQSALRSQFQAHSSEVARQSVGVQRKSIELSKPTDAAEKEADEVARKVVDRHPAQIRETGGMVNRQGEGSAKTTKEFQSRLESSKGGGQSLDDSTRREMESRMGADFSNVKIHTGREAQHMSEDINAKAFTHGPDIFLRQGEFSPNSWAGKELLAHELTHTVQQQGGSRFDGDGINRAELGSNTLRPPIQNHDSRGLPAIQRKEKADPAPDITDSEVTAAIAWATNTKVNLGKEAIHELQGAFGAAVTGAYDEATVRAVFARQREWQPKGAISNAGKATR